MSEPEIRRNPDGTIDEIVATGVDIHLEQMDKGDWYLNITDGEATTQIYFASKKRIHVTDPADVVESVKKALEGSAPTVTVDGQEPVGVNVYQSPAEPPTFIKFPSGEILP